MAYLRDHPPVRDQFRVRGGVRPSGLAVVPPPFPTREAPR